MKRTLLMALCALSFGGAALAEDEVSAGDYQADGNEADYGKHFDAANTPANDRLARPAPDWFTKGVIYQIQPRSFTEEGTIRAAMAKLPLVAESGANIVYLCPLTVMDDDQDPRYVLPLRNKDIELRVRAYSKCFYRVKDYYHVDPEFGTEEDVRAFVAEAHRLGLKVFFDVVFSHCGPKAVFIEEHPDWVRRDAQGGIVCNRWHMPQINFDNPELREYLTGSLLHWVKEFDVDGYRCDVAEEQPLSFWETARDRLDAVKPGVVLLCEGFGIPAEQVKAFDCCYCWTCKCILCDAIDGKRTLAEFLRQVRHKNAIMPRGGRKIWGFDTHDETDDAQVKGPRYDLPERWGHELVEASLAAMFLLDGVPMIYSGNEWADVSFQQFYRRTPINWDLRETAYGQKRLRLVRQLARLRRCDYVFTEGSGPEFIEWLENDCPEAVLSFMRKARDGRAAVCVFNLTKSPVAVTVKLGGQGAVADTPYVRERCENGGQGRYALGPGGFDVREYYAEEFIREN